jgi:hypothetical protein
MPKLPPTAPTEAIANRCQLFLKRFRTHMLVIAWCILMTASVLTGQYGGLVLGGALILIPVVLWLGESLLRAIGRALAHRWWSWAEANARRADERGDLRGTVGLGAARLCQGNLEGAEEAFRRADECGDAQGSAELGVMLEQRGDLEGAEAAFRRARERGCHRRAR